MQKFCAVATNARNAANERRATFADWQVAAILGCVTGGMRLPAAFAIVIAAADDIMPLVTRELTPELRQTFSAAFDIECARYVRRNGAACFAATRPH